MNIVREPMWDTPPRSQLAAGLRHLEKFLATCGWIVRLMVESVAAFPSVLVRRSGRRDLVKHLYITGIRTLPVVTVVSLFVGMILALQLGLELQRFNYEEYLGAAVMLTLMREMGPFACGICFSSCVGSAIAAELGTMKVNDEIAALEIMSISPVRYLAAPRILAMVMMAPLVSFFCVIIGAVGGGLVGFTQLNVEFNQYISAAMTMADSKDLYVGLVKSTWFGLVIGVIAVSEGFSTSMGATGVGRSTQRSVIVNFLLILMFGYMLTRVFYR